MKIERLYTNEIITFNRRLYLVQITIHLLQYSLILGLLLYKYIKNINSLGKFYQCDNSGDNNLALNVNIFYHINVTLILCVS